MFFFSQAPNIVGRLSVTFVQAKLVKNYGMTRMDPYARLRVGHYTYETQTDPNGGKMPMWNRVIHCQLPAGVNKITIEIFDECNFTVDERIAWTEIGLPEQVLRGETHEDWYPLSGRQGEGVEGMVKLVFSFSNIAPSASGAYLYQQVQPVVMVPGRPLPVFIAPTHQQQQQPGQIPPVSPGAINPQQITNAAPIPLNEEDLKQINEMFPNLDKEVIKSVFVTNNGNKDITINSLLQMTAP